MGAGRFVRLPESLHEAQVFLHLDGGLVVLCALAHLEHSFSSGCAWSAGSDAATVVHRSRCGFPAMGQRPVLTTERAATIVRSVYWFFVGMGLCRRLSSKRNLTSFLADL